MRNAQLALLAVALMTTPAWAQSATWLDKGFKGGTGHDFGSVPRGAELNHKFELTNIWAVPLEIVSVRTSCGCVTASASKQVVGQREKATIDITMDARRFTGSKTVSIYVVVGGQYSASSTLKVSANSRSDIVFNPGEINFGVVPRGQTPTQTLDMEYAGVLDWRVNSVALNGAPLDVRLEELYRRPGQVGYRVRVTVRADAQPGTLKHDLQLKTNDPASPVVPVLVEANIQAALTVVPVTLAVGAVPVGGEKALRVVLRGSKPFRITGIEGIGDGVDVKLPPASTVQAVQTLTVVYQPTAPGTIRRQVQVKTDLNQTATVTVEAQGVAK